MICGCVRASEFGIDPVQEVFIWLAMPKLAPQYENSAGRLLAIFSIITDNMTFSAWLRDCVPPNPTSIKKHGEDVHMFIADSLFEVRRLFEVFWDDLKKAPTMGDEQKLLFQKGLFDIYKRLSPSSITGAAPRLNDAQSSILQICASMLPRENGVEVSDLDAIQASVRELQKLVSSGDIGPVLKKSLLELIRLSEDTINRYNLVGARGLKVAFKTMLGEAMNLHGETERARAENKAGYEEHADDETAWKAIRAHFVVLDKVMVKVGEYLPVMEFISKIPLLH